METSIDTLEVTKQFEAVGIERKHAEVFAEVLRKYEKAIVNEVKAEAKERDDSYATKGDIRELKSELKADISNSSNKIIYWVAGLITAQTLAIVGLLLRFSGK